MKAAVGRRQPVRTRLRRALVSFLLRYDAKLRANRTGDYLEFVPATRDRAVLADLAARLNWYLGDRTLPIYMRGAAAVAVDPSDAPYMDPSIVHAPGWAPERPDGRPELVVHDLRPTTVLRFLTSRTRVTLASPWFADTADLSWFGLQRRTGSPRTVDSATSAERLLSRGVRGGSAFVLATGPSASLVDPDRVDADVRITCNSTVRNVELMRRLKPDVIAFSDPVFHCGPSVYAAEFRRDVERALDVTDAVLVSGDDWIGPVLAHHPRIAERIALVELGGGGPWRWPSRDDLSVRTTGNVLTLLMLPIAFALADRVELAGCDGRNPDERYFWKHNAETQYSDELMRTVFTAHPAFFRDRDYRDYYAQHCEELRELLEVGERAGKQSVSVTPSFIPALRERTPAPDAG